MNRIQNINNRASAKRNKELEIEVNSLRQKLEIIRSIIGMDDNIRNVPFIGEKVANARPVATVWRSKEDKVIFQTLNIEERDWLSEEINKQSQKVAEEVGKDTEEELKKDDSFAKHLKN